MKTNTQIEAKDAWILIALFAAVELIGWALLIAGIITTNYWLIGGGIGVILVALGGVVFVVFRATERQEKVSAKPVAKATEDVTRKMSGYANMMSTVNQLAAQSEKIEGVGLNRDNPEIEVKKVEAKPATPAKTKK